MDQVRFGLALRALRRRRGWTQQLLSDRAHLSRSAVQRIERGGVDEFTGRTVRKIAVALGARYDQRVLWQGEALDRLLDEDHAALVEQVVRWLRAEGWDVVPEATFVLAGQRGSVDVLAFHPSSGSLLIVEVKSVVPDMQAMLSGIDRTSRAAAVLARDRGWRAATVSRLLVLPDDRTARRRVDTHAATLAAALPARTRAVRRWARSPDGPMAGILFLPRTHSQGRHRVVART